MADIHGDIGREDRVSFEETGGPGKPSVFVGSPDYKVFIWGMDVTHDVFSISTALMLDDQISTATVNMVSDNQKWIMPSALAAIPFDFFPDELSARSDLNVLGTNTANAERNNLITPTQFALKKRERLLQKLSFDINRAAQIQPPKGAQITVDNFIAKFQNSQVFPFLPGSPLIQANDPIRIFFKNPWNLKSKSEAGNEEVWYFAFTGFVAAITEEFDATSNRSILRLLCEDIRRVMRWMRITTNVNIFDMNVLNEVVFSEDESALNANLAGRVAGEQSLFTGNANVNAGQILVDLSTGLPAKDLASIVAAGTTVEGSAQGIMDYLLFGNTDSNIKDTSTSATSTGVLGFNSQNKQVALLSSENLETEMSTPFSNSILDRIYPELTLADVKTYGADWSLGAVPDVRPEANTFFVILPRPENFPPTQLTYPFDYQYRQDFYSEFKSRLEVINSFIKDLDAIWYATPRGDIVLEFPQYDAIPGNHEPPWKNILTIQNEFIGFSKTEDDRGLKTLSIVAGSGIPGINDAAQHPFLAYAAIANPELIARYGVRQLLQNKPFYYGDKQASKHSLEGLASMFMELANSDAFRLEGLECLPNFRAPLARPYLFKFRNLIGFATEIHHRIVWNSEAVTTYNLKYVRHFDTAVKDWLKVSGGYGWWWAHPLNVHEVDLDASGAVESATQNPNINQAGSKEAKDIQKQAAEARRKAGSSTVGFTPISEGEFPTSPVFEDKTK